jgi:hypothetical protein
VLLFFRYTAVAVLEMDFDRIDINQCPKGQGNSGPNRFADTARCKKETTEVSVIFKLVLHSGCIAVKELVAVVCIHFK